MYRALFIAVISTKWCTNIYHNSISLYNVHFYIFRHLYVILREFYICTYLAKLHKMLKIEAAKITIP